MKIVIYFMGKKTLIFLMAVMIMVFFADVPAQAGAGVISGKIFMQFRDTTISVGHGVPVKLSGTSEMTTKTSGDPISDGSDNFWFEGLNDGTYTVTPMIDGNVIVTPASQTVTIKNGISSTPAYFKVEHNRSLCIGSKIDGSVWSIRTGQSMIASGSGDTVALSGPVSKTTVAAIVVGLPTSAPLNFCFPNLPSGTYTVTPIAVNYGFNPKSKVVTLPGATQIIEFGIVPLDYDYLYSIVGHVGSSSPDYTGARATVTLSGAAAKTTTADDFGMYYFRVDRGSYAISASKAGYTIAPASQTVTVSGVSVTAPDFTATPISYSISGTVTGGGGATVTLSGAAAKTATADVTTGAYSFTGLSNGTYTVMASKAGYMVSAAQAVTISGAAVTGKNFTATPISYSISGTVTGGGGATVTLSGAAAKTATADVTTGAYSFTGLSNGTYTVTANKAGYTIAPGTKSVAVNNSNVVIGTNFTATAIPYAIQGRVTVAANAAGLGGVTVTASATGLASKSATTAADGSFTITGLAGSTYTVSATMPAYTITPVSQTMALTDTANTAIANFAAFWHGYPISGTVTLNGAGTSGVVVSISGGTLYGTSTPTLQRTTDASGNYSFAGLGSGTYTVTPSLAGLTFTPASQAATISGSGKTGVNFAVTTYSISGMVIDNTVAMTNAMVVATNTTGAVLQTVPLAANGSYTLGSLPNGSYTITPFKPGYAFKPLNWPVTLSGANVGGKNFTGYLMANSISGRVTSKGTGWAGVKVTLTGISVKYSVSTTTDSQGNYAFTGVAIGSYDVTPSITGTVFTPLSKKVSMTGAGLPNNNFAY